MLATLLVAAWLAPVPALGQEGDEPPADPFADALEAEAARTESGPSGLGDDPRAIEAWVLARSGRLIKARELASDMLATQPGSYAAHFVLGVAMHYAEGDLPGALYHLKQARQSFEGIYSDDPSADAPWRWHAHVLAELAWVAGAMGRHEDKLAYLDDRDALYDPPWPAERGWPLMRLRRYDDARAAVEAGLATGDTTQTTIANTALCAIEAEQHKRVEANAACREAAAFAREIGPNGPTVFTNAAEAALGVLDFAAAERFSLEGTRQRSRATVSNPWMDLMVLYLGQGRIAQGLEALRNMFAWRDRQPAVVSVQNRSEIDMAAIAFLLTSGHAERAVSLTGRVLDRPDRTGFSSSEEEQMTAAAAAIDSVANRLRARQLDEQASWSGLRDGVWLNAQALRHRMRAWLSARRAAAAMADHRMLVATLRPYLAGSVELPEWLEPELVSMLGPGLVQAALEDAMREETLSDAAGYFDTFGAEIALRQNRPRAALDLVELAAIGLPESEMLLRARLWAIGARASLDTGQGNRALRYLDQALQIDPGAVRAFDLALPTVFATGDSAAAKRTIRLLRGSPRFRAAKTGFRIDVTATAKAGEACLRDPRGAVVACGRVSERAGDHEGDLPRRLAAALHEKAFAPRIDLTQADLRTLDGAPTAAGGRSAERLRTVIDQVID